jgi:transcriptional regulator with XRE-family HTH domain
MSEALKRKIGSVVRAAREQLGITQEELAKRVEKDVDSISLIERGRSLPPLKTLLALVDALDVPLQDFVGMPAGEAGKTRQRFYLEAQIVAMIRQLSDRELELVRDQVALVMKHHSQKKRR